MFVPLCSWITIFKPYPYKRFPNFSEAKCLYDNMKYLFYAEISSVCIGQTQRISGNCSPRYVTNARKPVSICPQTEILKCFDIPVLSSIKRAWLSY